MIVWSESWGRILKRIKHNTNIMCYPDYHYLTLLVWGFHSLALFNFGILELQWLWISEIWTQSFMAQLKIVLNDFSGKCLLVCLVGYDCGSGTNNNKNTIYVVPSLKLYYKFVSILLDLRYEVFFGYIRGERMKTFKPLKAITGSSFWKNNACQEWHLCNDLFVTFLNCFKKNKTRLLMHFNTISIS